MFESYCINRRRKPNHLEIIPGQAAWWRQDEARAARAWKLMERVLPKEWAAWNDFGMTDPMQSWPKTLWSAQSAPLSLAFPWTCRCLHTSQPGIAVWSAQPLRRARQIRNHPATHKVPKMPAPKILDCGHVRNQKQIQVWGYWHKTLTTNVIKSERRVRLRSSANYLRIKVPPCATPPSTASVMPRCKALRNAAPFCGAARFTTSPAILQFWGRPPDEKWIDKLKSHGFEFENGFSNENELGLN